MKFNVSCYLLVSLSCCLLYKAQAAIIEAGDTMKCRKVSGDNYYESEVVNLKSLSISCDGTEHDSDGDGDYGEEYTDEYGVDIYDEEGEEEGYGNAYEDEYGVDEYGGRRLNAGDSCGFGQTATITGVVEILEDVDTEMYLELSISMFRLSKTLVNGINLCDLGDLGSYDDATRCPEVGSYTFSQTYDIPSSEYGFLTTGFTGNIRAEIQDDKGYELGCSKTTLTSVRTDDDPPLTGAEIALIVISLVVLCVACTCCACRASGDDESMYRRKMPLVYPRRNAGQDYGMYA